MRNEKLEGEELHSIDWASDHGQRTFVSNAFKGKERVTKEANSSSGYKFGRHFPINFVQCL